jgi:hypothetical protein
MTVSTTRLREIRERVEDEKMQYGTYVLVDVVQVERRPVNGNGTPTGYSLCHSHHPQLHLLSCRGSLRRGE